MNNQIALVTPIYEDNESSRKLLSDIKKIYKQNIFIVAVDDGSLVDPFEVKFLEELLLDGVVIKLKKNVGHQKAIAVGLQYVAKELKWASRIVVMDSDGEDNPNKIQDLINSCKSEKIDIAVASRSSRSETRQFVFFYNVYKVIFRVLTGRSISFGNFMCIKRNALKRIIMMPELWTHLAACVLSSKLRLSSCSIDRGKRYFGQSKSNFIGFALHGFKALMIFSEEVLVRVGVFCAIIAALAILGGLIAILLKFIGIATPGWFSIVMGIFILVFLQTGTLTLMTLLLTGVSKKDNYNDLTYQLYLESVHKSNICETS